MLDDKLILSEKQSIVGATGDIVSTNVIDFQAVKPDPGTGRPVYLNAVIAESVAGGSVALALQDSADNSTYATKYTTGAIAAASLPAGTKVLRMPLPEGLARYIRVQYTISSAATTAGKVTAWLDIN